MTQDCPPPFSPTTRKRIVLAAGGTGGHVFPAEAVAAVLRDRGYEVTLHTDARGAAVGQDLTLPLLRLAAQSPSTRWRHKLRFFFSLAVSFRQAYRALRADPPAAVVGFGGYPAAPTLAAALWCRIPIVLHDQNATLGRVTRLFARVAQSVATCFSQTRGLSPTCPARVVVTGNPVRAPFMALRDSHPYQPPEEGAPIRLVILGGSLGSQKIAHLVPEALNLLPASQRQRLVVSQQTRTADHDAVEEVYARSGLRATLAPFFSDVAQRMAEAHLVIARAGGTTVAELTTLGRPALLIPYPYGHAGEQVANAQALAHGGAAWIMPEQTLTPQTLAMRIESLLSAPPTLAKAAEAARVLGTPQAAKRLADAIENVFA